MRQSCKPARMAVQVSCVQKILIKHLHVVCNTTGHLGISQRWAGHVQALPHAPGHMPRPARVIDLRYPRSCTPSPAAGRPRLPAARRRLGDAGLPLWSFLRRGSSQACWCESQQCISSTRGGSSLTCIPRVAAPLQQQQVARGRLLRGAAAPHAQAARVAADNALQLPPVRIPVVQEQRAPAAGTSPGRAPVLGL